MKGPNLSKKLKWFIIYLKLGKMITFVNHFYQILFDRRDCTFIAEHFTVQFFHFKSLMRIGLINGLFIYYLVDGIWKVDEAGMLWLHTVG